MIFRLRFFAAFLLVIAPGLLSAQSVESAASHTASVNRSRLIGRWTLVKEGHFDTRGLYTPVGEHMSGQLIYAQDGSMSVLITIVPKPAALSDIIAYSGTFTLDGNKVLHHIQFSSDSDRVGTTAVRITSFRGDQLVLATEPNSAGRYEAVWRR